MSEPDATEFETKLRGLLKRALDGEERFDVLRGEHIDLEQLVHRAHSGDERAAAIRAVAGNLLTVAQILEEPTSVCAPLFKRVIELGFHDTQDRLLQVAAYARYCLERKYTSAVEVHLERALEEARGVFEPSKLVPFEDLLTRIKNAST